MVRDAVGKIIEQIPAGSVASYSQVAYYVGIPGGARVVGNILRTWRGGEIPWWRVVNNQGRITLKGNWSVTAVNQRELLRNEGVVVDDNFKLDINRYRYWPEKNILSRWRIDL